MKNLKRLLPYLRRYRTKLVGGVLSILVAATFGLFSPIVVGHAVDALKGAFSNRTLLIYALLVVGIAAFRGVFSFLQRLILVSMSRDIEYDLRNDYFTHLERMPQAFFHKSYTGDLMARGTNDLQAVRMICGPAIMYSSNTLFTGTGALLLMMNIHWKLTLVALCTMPLVAIVTKFFGQRIHVIFERVQESFSGLSTNVQENLAGVRVVRAYSQENSAEDAFRRINREYVDHNRTLIRWTAAFHPTLQALIGIGFVAVLWYGGLLVRQSAITIGEFVTFNLFLMKLIWPMIAIGWVINLVQRGSASLGRLLEIMDLEPAVRDEQPLTTLPVVRGEIQFRQLNFAYQEGTGSQLRDINLRIPAGETLAVVGRTGSGKSTLLALIPRLINAPEGTLTIDGIDVRHLPLAILRNSIAAVPQESFLFSASVRENILFGCPTATERDFDATVEIAGLAPDIASFPKGLETLVGERGITLSGGQKQRVALARALLRNPKILLMDDCLSAVDTHTEETILTNLREVLRDRTVLLVSHRISTVKNSDRIVVLEDGKIAAQGTHEELRLQAGLYAELDQRQRLEEELAAV